MISVPEVRRSSKQHFWWWWWILRMHVSTYPRALHVSLIVLDQQAANCDLEAGQHVHSLPDCNSHFRNVTDCCYKVLFATWTRDVGWTLLLLLTPSTHICDIVLVNLTHLVTLSQLEDGSSAGGWRLVWVLRPPHMVTTRLYTTNTHPWPVTHAACLIIFWWYWSLQLNLEMGNIFGFKKQKLS